jgi:UDP-GlcNAc:undecaprenyl-phosphate GlcNAc-1-phosphate transferase
MSQLNQYFWPFLAALFLSTGATYLVRHFALKRGLITPKKPRSRDIHKTATPRLGGVALFAAFWVVVAILYSLFPSRLSFIDWKILGLDANLLGVFLGSALLLGVHVLDDIRGVSAGWKLTSHIAAGALLALFGIRIWWLSNPFGGTIYLDPWQSHLLVIGWTVLVINVVNFLDGLDGLASGVSGIGGVVLLLLALTPYIDQTNSALLLAVFIGAIVGFLPWNFHPAKIFLGDSGSTFLGFLLATFSIISGAKVATAFLVLGVAMLDAVWVIGRRILSGVAPYRADRKHLHHRLLDLGLTQPQIVLFYLAISAAFGWIALRFSRLPINEATQGKLTAMLWLLSVVGATALVVVFLEARKRWNYSSKARK